MTSPGPFCDAHNHLQDLRFADRQDRLLEAARAAGVARMAVNGTHEADWPAVAALARGHPGRVMASFGLHPWHLGRQSPGWSDRLVRLLDEHPEAGVGEIGLDRWILEQPDLWRARIASAHDARREPPSLAEQEAAFLLQLQIAADRNRPASIHCLRAFGRLRELLAGHERPACGFLLHSYGGPAELVPEFVRLGGYFSFSGHFLHGRKAAQREVFRAVPSDRLLVETDAPDQLLPEPLRSHPLADRAGAPLNHPANLPPVYAGLASVLGESVTVLADRTAANFARLFGP